MPFNVNDFTKHYSNYNETSKADKFDVMISLPRLLTSSFGNFGSRELSLECEQAEFPGIDVVPIEYRHYGFIRRIPHHLNFSPLSLTFYCNGQMLEKKLFDVWVGLCIPSYGNGPGLIQYRQDSAGNPNYEGIINIRQYNQTGDITYTAMAFECMPISVSSIPTNWSDDSTSRVTVTFAYTKWSSQLNAPPGLNLPVNNFTNRLISLGESLLGQRINSELTLVNRKVTNAIGKKINPVTQSYIKALI